MKNILKQVLIWKVTQKTDNLTTNVNCKTFYTLEKNGDRKGCDHTKAILLPLWTIFDSLKITGTVFSISGGKIYSGIDLAVCGNDMGNGLKKVFFPFLIMPHGQEYKLTYCLHDMRDDCYNSCCPSSPWFQ